MRKWLSFFGIVGFLSISARYSIQNVEKKVDALPEKGKTTAKIIPREKVKISFPLLSRQDAQLFSDSVCRSIGVPPNLVREIGENESGWRCIKSLSGGSDYGDLQIIQPTFNYWYSKLGLKGGSTRANYLIVGIHYLKERHNKYKSWEKARYAYARGEWIANQTKWTSLETKFMNKIDWSQYD